MPIPAQPVQKGSGSVSVAPFQALPHGSLMATGMQQAHGTSPQANALPTSSVLQLTPIAIYHTQICTQARTSPKRRAEATSRASTLISPSTAEPVLDMRRMIMECTAL